MVAFRSNLKQAQLYGFAYGFSQSVVFAMYGGAFRFGAWQVSLGEMAPENVYKWDFYGIFKFNQPSNIHEQINIPKFKSYLNLYHALEHTRTYSSKLKIPIKTIYNYCL